MHPLEGVRQKMNRAKEQLAQIEDEVASFWERKPYGSIGHYEPESSRYVFSIRVFEPTPFARWGVLVGEFIHNVRSAIDHVAWQLVCLNNRKPIERQTGFPICMNPSDWHTQRGGGLWMLEGASDHIKTEIEGLQPYHAGDLKRDHYLAVLQDLWNIDKHRVLHTVAVVPDEVGLTPLPLRDVERVIDTEIVTPDRIEEGAEFGYAVIEPSGPNPKMRVDSYFHLAIAFGPPSLAEDADVSALLKLIWTNVQGDILERFRDDFG